MLHNLLAFFSISATSTVQKLGPYAEVSLPESWQQEISSYYSYISFQEMKLSPEAREKRRPHWDRQLNDRELTFYFTSDAKDTMGGRFIPNILRITFFNPAKESLTQPEYLKALAEKNFGFDGVGGLADRKFTQQTDKSWFHEMSTQRSGWLGMVDYKSRSYLTDVDHVRILLTTSSEFYSEQESKELLESVKKSLKIKNIASYFNGTIPHFKPFYLSGPDSNFNSDTEILSYDWKNQIITFSRSPGSIGNFKVHLGDEILYEMEMVSPFSARIINSPVAYPEVNTGEHTLRLRPTHDFVNKGRAAPELSSPEWKDIAREDVRQHFKLLDKLVE